MRVCESIKIFIKYLPELLYIKRAVQGSRPGSKCKSVSTMVPFISTNVSNLFVNDVTWT